MFSPLGKALYRCSRSNIKNQWEACLLYKRVWWDDILKKFAWSAIEHECVLCIN